MSNESQAHEPSSAATPPGTIHRVRKRRWLKWILLTGLALSCCCGGPIAILPITWVRGGKQFEQIHQSLSPGMSTSELLAQVSKFRPSRFGLVNLYLYPREGPDQGTALEPLAGACPAEASWAWRPDEGAPWGRGDNPRLETAAMALASCEKVDIVGHISTFHVHFAVTLADGKIATIGPIEGEF